MLEARDKLMKSRGLHRKFEGTVLVGTCPDICPERERYSRAAKNQLRVYEKFEDGGVNHKAVVKEYSRSSADQASLTSFGSQLLICSSIVTNSLSQPGCPSPA